MADIWDESASFAFWGRVDQFRRLSAIVGRCAETVTESDSPREMVLETWLAVDYAVRDLVVSGYGLHQFCQEDFDLRYKLLPRGFRELLRLLRATTSYYSGLDQEPSSSIDYPPYLRSSVGFLKYLTENHGDLVERLEEIEVEYRACPQKLHRIEWFYCDPLGI